MAAIYLADTRRQYQLHPPATIFFDHFIISAVPYHLPLPFCYEAHRLFVPGSGFLRVPSQIVMFRMPSHCRSELLYFFTPNSSPGMQCLALLPISVFRFNVSPDSIPIPACVRSRQHRHSRCECSAGRGGGQGGLRSTRKLCAAPENDNKLFHCFETGRERDATFACYLIPCSRGLLYLSATLTSIFIYNE